MRKAYPGGESAGSPWSHIHGWRYFRMAGIMFPEHLIRPARCARRVDMITRFSFTNPQRHTICYFRTKKKDVA